VFVLLGNGAQAFEGYSDPLCPPAVDDCPLMPETPFYQIGTRLKQVDELIEQETQALNALAPLQPSKQFDTFGYHSDYIPAVDGVPDEPLWTLDIDAGIPNRRILGMVMVPAMDQRSVELKGYAFPKRFRICSIDSDGEILSVHVDWTARDFPDPGMRPVMFKFPSEYASDVETVSRNGFRLEVFSGQEDHGLEFFALARVHLIRTAELHWSRQISASSSFESAPYWSSEYLASSQHTLGLPLSAKDGTDGDLVMKVPSSKLAKDLIIRVRLEESDQLGWVNIFPGQNPDGIDVPGYGFPKTIHISRLVRRANKSGFRSYPMEDLVIPSSPDTHMVRVTDLGKNVGALEIACNDFPVYQGQAIFALGEIEILMRGRNLSRGRPVNLRWANIEGFPDLSVLVDGRVGGRNILTLIDWTGQLAAGKPHEARLSLLEAEWLQLTERGHRVRRVFLIGGGGLVLIVIGLALAVAGYSIIQRRQSLKKLKVRITRDLHDEVGSSLGGITLAARRMEDVGASPSDLAELSLMAREASASLKDVVWVIDQTTIRLPELLKKFAERAERVLYGITLDVELPEDCPDCEVTLTFKRHLLMFFKEAVHNCARHSGATEVQIRISVETEILSLSLEDNGWGFDPNVKQDGWGVSNMRKRAKELGGKMDLQTAVGKGTMIMLVVPLSALRTESDHSYHTSN
jgi:signal transduction histidine kinase